MRTLPLLLALAAAAQAQSEMTIGTEILFGGGLAQAPLQSRQTGLSISFGKVRVANTGKEGEGGAAGERTSVEAAPPAPVAALDESSVEPVRELPDVELPSSDPADLVVELAGELPERRAAAARQLARAKDPAAKTEALGHLRQALYDSDPRVTSVIITALVELGDPAAIPDLRDLVLNGEDGHAIEAIHALRQLKDPDLREFLEPLAGAGTGPVSSVALETLGGVR